MQSHGQVHEEGVEEMMNRGNMGMQIANAPASRLPVVTQLDKMRTMPMGMKKGGMVKGYAKGGKVGRGDGCCMKGHTKGMMR
jgi:hypothetical protein